MGFKIETGVFLLEELGSLLKRFQVEPPEELQFPTTFKLDDKYALHLDRRGFGLVSGEYKQRYSYVVTKNQVVQLEKD
jgi:hypothetical protein